MDIEKVKKIAILAGKEIMKVYEDPSSFNVQSKADDSPLTLADQRANEVICKGLIDLDQDIPIISEENKLVSYEVRKDYDFFWMVDPLDGTKEFIKRNGDFTVNIALIHNHRSVAGVVYIPVTEELYWAEKGKGAWYQADGEEPSQIQSSNYSLKQASLKVVCSRSHLNPDTQNFLDKLDKPIIVSRGSSLKFLVIARGEADLYPRMAPTMEWDTAAAQIILEEAGGTVLQSDGINPLEYNKEDLTNPHFIAAGAATI